MLTRHLSFEHYHTMPWKNGGGVTHEIAVGPAGTDLSGDFLWRLSIAEVASSGPFSAFPGIDRTLTVLQGEGLRLDFGGGETLLLDRRWHPLAFDGGRACQGTLLGGPVTDFNVMTRRGRARHEVRFLVLPAETLTEPLEGSVLALLSLAGTLTVVCGEVEAPLQPRDCFLVEAGGDDTLAWSIEGDSAAAALMVRIDLLD